MLPISELIDKAQAGDQQALEQIIVAYQERVAAHVLSIVGADDDWEDVCQQVFVNMVLGLRRLKRIATFEPWLFRIARNACFDHLRRRRVRRILVPWQKSYDSIAAEPQNLQVLNGAALDTAFAQLSPDERELLLLVRDCRLSYSKLTAMTGKSISAIKSRLFRARRRLRQLMMNAINS